MFWAGATESPPELAADLATRGILRKVTVQATTDVETVTTGLRPPPDSRLPTPPDSHRHRKGSFAVDIYLAVPDDPEFGFNRALNFAPSLVSYASFPSLLYGDGSLPSPDRHYRVMTIDPYATSHVFSACFPETLAAVGEVRPRIGGLGDEYYEADVTWIGHPRDWMLTRAFRRAALAPDTEPLDGRRRSVVVLARKDGELVFVREGRS